MDENLPQEFSAALRDRGFDADTAGDEGLSGAADPVIAERCRGEGRVLITLDLDFSNICNYPPNSYPGIVVLRCDSQDKRELMDMLQKLIAALTRLSPDRELWIVGSDRIRRRTSTAH